MLSSTIFSEYYDGSRDLNSKLSDRDKERGERQAKKRDLTDDTKQRFHITVGTDSGLNKGAILRIVCEAADISSNEVGRTFLFREFSFFDVDKKYADKVLDGMRGAEFNNEAFKVQFAKSGGGGNGRSRGGGGRSRNRGGSGGGGRRRDGGGGKSYSGSRNSGGNNSGGNGGGSRDRDRRRRRS